MFVIILNCVTLGMYQPCNDNVCTTLRCKILENSDHFIFAFFAIEMIIKIIAMGFWGEMTYLAESWNRLDMFIVMAGTMEYGIDSENLSLSAIRTIRVLRPLRAINRIPSMRILVMLLLDTLPMLGNVLLLCFFVFFIFGIIGVQLWAGVLRNRCFINISDDIPYKHLNLTPYYLPMKDYEDYICARPGESGGRECQNLPRYQFEGIKCNASAKPFHNNTPTNSSCVNWNQYYTVCDASDKNPFQGAISFDNIGLAWVAIFQVISLESWVNIMYYVQDAHSFWDWTYFVALIVIGSFFMINLCLVVIATQFSETKKRETERMLQERKRYQSSSTLASNSEPSSCYNEILKYLAHLYRRAKRKLLKVYYEKTGQSHKKVLPQLVLGKKKRKGIHTHSHVCNHARSKNMRNAHYHYLYLNHENVSSCPDSTPNHVAPRASPEASEIDPISSPRRPFLTVPSAGLHSSSQSLNTLALAAAEVLTPSLFKSFVPPSPNHLSPNMSNSNSRNPSFSFDGSVRHLHILPDVISTHSAKNVSIAASNTLVNDEFDNFKFHHVNEKATISDTYLPDAVQDTYYPRFQCALPGDHEVCCYKDCEFAGDHDNEFEMEYKHEMNQCAVCRQDQEEKKKTHRNFLKPAQKFVKKIVESKVFQRGILISILFNTLSMGIEYHNQPPELTRALEISNLVFATLFAAEMLLKLISYGVFGYIKNGFNLFDGIIVILSLVELMNQDGGSGLSVLRTFRLLRILKLVRFMPALQRQLIVMLRTMDNVATFFALLLLFMFIFSVLGMNLFGGKFCWRTDGSAVPCTCIESLDPSICECDRANFNSLLWSLVTVFQVLTQEDWNTVLYNGMEKTSAWAALYFVALMTFGNYVLFNLLVAILVEGFSSEEDEKKRRRESIKERTLEIIQETNNNERRDSVKAKVAEVLDVKINNKERELLLGLNMVAKEEGNKVFTLPPPIITHTEATPTATPQGSPNEHSEREVGRHADMSSLTVEISTLNNTAQRLSCNSSLSTSSNRLCCNLSRASSCRTPTVSFRTSPKMSRVSPRPSPRPSPRLWRSHSYGSRRNSWKLKRTKDGDKAKLVEPGTKQEDNDDDVDFGDYDEEEDDEVFKPTTSQPILKTGVCKSSECNGDIMLNNRRAFSSHQNLIFQRRMSSPRNSIKSRNNSSSSAKSICNSFHLSRQNTFPSRRALPSMSSVGSGYFNDDYKQNDLSEPTNEKDDHDDSLYDEEDPDAMDETNCNYSWCPKAHGIFLERQEYSMYIFSPNNLVRRFAFHTIAQRWFDNTVLFFIALNCITLAMERPDIPPDSTERKILTISNHIFTAIFTIEMTVKVLAKGLLFGKHAYFKSGWNVMDGFLVVISLVDTMISLTANSSPRIFGILRVFRLLRTLRPLRVISRAPGLKLVVQTLLSSLRPIGNIVLICCTFFIIFGILGVQLFKGTFYYCKGPDVAHIQNRTHCLESKRNVWVNRKYNFDNLGMALMALFVLASKDGWVSIMYTGLDAVGVDQQPEQNYNEWRLIYFISFLLLVGFFVLNMFVGVVVENFHKCRESQEKEEKARRAEKRQQKLDQKRRQIVAQPGLQQCPYWARYGKPRLIIYTVINSKYFDLAIAGVIGLNVITMAMEFYMMPKELEFALQIFNYFFTSVFILEAAMKIIALGTIRYMRDRWNQLDIFIVILSIVGIVLEEMKTNVIPINPTIIRVMRVLRIARVLKLLKMAKGIRALLDTVIQALPQVGNLGLLFFLLFFIFAALGVELFGRLECSEDHPCEGLGEHAHFRNFGMAFLTLFRVATGDNWNGIMKDTLREDCNKSEDCKINCCVNPVIAPVYFVIFVLMAQFVLVNVVVAVLMKHLEETYKYKELDDEVEEELKHEMDEMRKAALRENFEMAKFKDSHKMIDDEAELEDLFRRQVREFALGQVNGNGKDDSDDDKGDSGPTDRLLPPPPTLTLRPPSCEPSPPSPTATLWTSDAERGMLLDPMAITINVPNDKNTLKVPSISSMDGRLLPLPPRERHYSDSNPDAGKFNRNSTSSPSPSLLGERPCIKRPVSEQNINYKSKSRKEKAVSWYSKIPTSTQTLGCVEGVNDDRSADLPNTQSQPLLGTLEGNSERKHICRHTYSVRQIKSPKEQKKSWNIRRSASSGSEKSKIKEKYLQLRPTNKIEDCCSPLTIANEARLARRLNNSRQSSLDTAKSEEMSLIDWEEDEKFCDEEVGNITGCFGDEEEEVRPTVRSVNPDSEHSVSCVPCPRDGNSLEIPDTSNNVTNHSILTTGVSPLHVSSCDVSLKCDQTGLNYASTDSNSKSTLSVPCVSLAVDSKTALKPLSLDKSIPSNCLLGVPKETVPKPLCNSRGLLGENTLFVGVGTLDEKRPPLPNNQQTGESHL
ncbi:voltage-dependent T-type calcium channel subunit alpha-1I-like isoform X3 [Mya arenaria]|uniref:voltage-dependent T-type calcium channel subunit alpha-1I-like isoform X3 n=1 Tax=Mya arenaria TaxID=6604 RepID=UPI0022E2B95C|nr:voltage-dependent T-type calcium channel subunit alpha-1I-like isoform X3 [Mya arenaria]